MALDHCFQLISSPPTTAAAFKPDAGVAFASRTTCKAPSSGLSFSSSSSSLSLRANRHRRTSFVCKAKEAVNEVTAVTDSTWDSLVLGSGVPVLVDFWAPWCGPCRMIAPVIDDLAKEFSGKIACYKCNTDECPNIATKYGIRSIPTVLFFKNGERKESVIGAVPKQTLVSTIEKYLNV